LGEKTSHKTGILENIKQRKKIEEGGKKKEVGRGSRLTGRAKSWHKERNTNKR